METSDDRLEGACRCGRTVIEVTAPPILTAACHCRGCQRMAASAFSLTAIFEIDAFRVLRGEPEPCGLQRPQEDDPGAWEIHHACCGFCKSWMFTRIKGLDDIVNVRSVMFDDPRWTTPFIETMTSARLPWATTPARHSYEGFPPMEDYQRLMEEFAAAR